MNKKMGRPVLPKGESKGAQSGVRLKQNEDKAIASIATRAGETKAETLREAAIDKIQAPPIWVKSEWKADDLNGHYIQFLLHAPNRRLEGVGELKVRTNTRGEIAVDIFVDEHPTPYQGVTTRIWLSKEAVDRIELNPNPKPAKFRLLA